MSERYDYIIVGAGLAGASAVEGVREVDTSGQVLLLGAEPDRPYHRPPLSKKLWFGDEKVEGVFVHDADFYAEQGVKLGLGTQVVKLDPRARTVTTADGSQYQYGKLLLATGGVPRRLAIPGGDIPEICYFRTRQDYLALRAGAVPGAHALVIGGGFIGSELACALAHAQVQVTMLFPSSHVCSRVFPHGLGDALGARLSARGITILAFDKPISIHHTGHRFHTETEGGRKIESDLLVAGVGVSPATELALQGGLRVDGGICVNQYLQTSAPDIYAAGDNAVFPSALLGRPVRVEHWDNALNQGRLAGKNMAGAHAPYAYSPYFFSDLFDFGYEAVGDVDARHETFADWQQTNEKGVIYYLENALVRGVMLCNVWGQVDAARALIMAQTRGSAEALRGAIPFGD
ncbi:MAG: FAD/NAD(P)-binding oxidoreductase [Betaproteobacteria bacterium]|nr:FAD/NAD(P)-binding oxidoreductase [Betaproteobacteria bacterium]